MLNIGVLALQGAVAEHIRAIEIVGGKGIAVKKTDLLAECDGLIIPGGESTTISKLMRAYHFMEAIELFHQQGKPIFGTCAGLILMANHIQGEKSHLNLMDISVERNAFGRQRESFETELNIMGIDGPIRAIFIRAPIIKAIGKDVEVIGTYSNQIVAARQNNLVVASFHPELTDDFQFHNYFLKMVEKASIDAKN
jgi:5'-phosphate synthase pdxT subunit